MTRRQGTSPTLPRLLVVDDEERAVELLVRTLRKKAQVVTAASGEEAWDRFQEGEFAMILSDQRMPGLTGVDLLSRVAEVDETVGRILLTGYSDLEATVEAINRGRVHAYLHKPCSPPDLIATFQGVLDRVTLARDNARLLACLQDAEAEVHASERLAAIGKMTAMVTHDLRSPMTSLRGAQHRLEELAAESGLEGLVEVRDVIAAETDFMERMCNELLEVARLSEPSRPRRPAPLDEIVSLAIGPLLEPASHQGVDVELHLEADVELELDEDALRRALANLVQNALEAMPEGGSLRVETARDELAAWLRISDNGAGIPDEIAGRLFEPFVTSGKPGGTGLGLAIVHKVILDHGGSIEVAKPEGGGSAFTLRLPLEAAP